MSNETRSQNSDPARVAKPCGAVSGALKENLCAADQLVAHRGFPAAYPENSLAGVQAALEAGARFVEIDIQLSRDGVPVVVHDDTLTRVGRASDIGTDAVGLLDHQTLAGRTIGEPERFGDAYAGQCVPTLSAMLALVDRYPAVTVFIELKRESLARFGHEAMVEPVLAEMRRAANPCVAISFDAIALQILRARECAAIGLCLEQWNTSTRRVAERLGPDYLFVRSDRIPSGEKPFWPGAWQWAVYVVDNPDTARRLFSRGAALVETDHIGPMIRALS